MNCTKYDNAMDTEAYNFTGFPWLLEKVFKKKGGKIPMKTKVLKLDAPTPMPVWFLGIFLWTLQNIVTPDFYFFVSWIITNNSASYI